MMKPYTKQQQMAKHGKGATIPKFEIKRDFSTNKAMEHPKRWLHGKKF